MALCGILTMNLVKAKKLVKIHLEQQHSGGGLSSVKLGLRVKFLKWAKKSPISTTKQELEEHSYNIGPQGKVNQSRIKLHLKRNMKLK